MADDCGDTCSSSSEDEAVLGIHPYSFEPYAKPDEQAESSNDLMKQDLNRLQSIDWCQCGYCVKMPSIRESLCCQEVSQIKVMTRQTTPCITQHPGFRTVCLDPYVLLVAYLQYKQQYGHQITNQNNRYRYTAYRQLARFIWEILGRHIRAVLPACAVHLIRQTFPSANGIYTGFLEPEPEQKISASAS